MIKTLKLKHLNLKSNLVQGPLAGYSTAPFRSLTHRYGKPGFSMTEMISAKDLVYRNPNPKRYLYRDPEEGLLGYQLACNEPDILKRAIAIISPYQPDIIDLNCGCPVKKIRQKGLGSKLLASPEQIYHLVSAMRESTDAVISIKIRTANSRLDQNNIEILKAAESAGVDFITVHGRHWQERYDIASNLDEIKAIKAQATVPIIANGDAEDAISVQNIFQKTQADGIMIARASVGRPWLFAEIQAALTNQTFEIPCAESRGEIFIEHIEKLAQLENEILAVLQSRKLAKYYANGLHGAVEFVKAVQETSDIGTLKKLSSHFFCSEHNI